MTMPVPAPPPADPVPSDASKGILGPVLATVLAGDYTLQCHDSSEFF